MDKWIMDKAHMDKHQCKLTLNYNYNLFDDLKSTLVVNFFKSPDSHTPHILNLTKVSLELSFRLKKENLINLL